MITSSSAESVREGTKLSYQLIPILLPIFFKLIGMSEIPSRTSEFVSEPLLPCFLGRERASDYGWSTTDTVVVLLSSFKKVKNMHIKMSVSQKYHVAEQGD